MGNGIYLGGHTKIALSEAGTLWPATSEVDRSSEPKTPTGKRWADDCVQTSDGLPGPASSELKQAEMLVLAEYASAVRTKRAAKTLKKLPSALVESINRLGGVISWINADERRLGKFWKLVDEQETRPPLVPKKLVKFPKSKKGAGRRP